MTELLRHTLATTAYRFQNVMLEATDDFGSFEPGNEVKNPASLIKHMGNVIAYAISVVRNTPRKPVNPKDFRQGTRIFIEKLEELDQLVAEGKVPAKVAKEIFQGPISDVLTHVGQLAMMRRLSGHPIISQNYPKAKVEAGKFDYFA